VRAILIYNLRNNPDGPRPRKAIYWLR